MGEGIFDRNALSPEAAQLLEILLRHTDEIGRAQISTTALLRDSGLPQSALTRAREELSSQSLLCVEPGYSARGLRGANVYVLNLGALEPPSDISSTGESGENVTEGTASAASPADPGSSVEFARPTSGRKGWWARLFRRAEAS
jgi:hypothetical protein